MAKVTKKGTRSRMRPAIDPDKREQQLIAQAVDLAEQQLMDGTASSQVITHFLKLASSRERLEREKMELENQLIKAKAEAIKSQETKEELYKKALQAMSRYSGHSIDDEEDEDYDELLSTNLNREDDYYD